MRVLNLAACLVLLAFNGLLGIGPMNAILSVINLWFISRLLREQHDEAALEMLEADDDVVLPTAPGTHGD